MSYSLFSTENADYELVYAIHIIETKEDIFEKGKIESLDAIVLENSGMTPWQCHKIIDQDGDSQYNAILHAAHEAGKPLYFVDVGTTILGAAISTASSLLLVLLGYFAANSSLKDMQRHKSEGKKFSRREFLKTTAKGIAGAAFITESVLSYLSPFTGGESIGVSPAIVAAKENILPSPEVALRNAITARKLEEFVAPALKNELGKKPKIALVYGAAHAGIEGCIQHKWRRDRLIDFSGITGNMGIKEEHLNTAYKLSPSNILNAITEIAGLWWDVRTYNCHLF